MVLCISYQSVMKLSRVRIWFFSLWNYGTSVARTSDSSNTFWQSLRVRASEVLLYNYFQCLEEGLGVMQVKWFNFCREFDLITSVPSPMYTWKRVLLLVQDNKLAFTEGYLIYCSQERYCNISVICSSLLYIIYKVAYGCLPSLFFT